MVRLAHMLVIVALFALSSIGGVAHASSTGPLGFSLTIEPTSEPTEFVVSGVVRDLASDAIIASPSLTVAAGKDASTTASGDDGSTDFALAVSIDSTLTRATWRFTATRDGVALGASDGIVTLRVAATTGY